MVDFLQTECMEGITSSDGDQNYLQAYKTVEYNLHIFSLHFLRCHFLRLESRQGYGYIHGADGVTVLGNSKKMLM